MPHDCQHLEYLMAGVFLASVVLIGGAMLAAALIGLWCKSLVRRSLTGR